MTEVAGRFVYVCECDIYVHNEMYVCKCEMAEVRRIHQRKCEIYEYGVARISRLLKIIGLFCRI